MKINNLYKNWSREQMCYNLRLCQNILDRLYFKHNFLALVTYGNSLGRLRNGHFIPHDYDLDTICRGDLTAEMISDITNHFKDTENATVVYLREENHKTFDKLRIIDETNNIAFDIDFFNVADARQLDWLFRHNHTKTPELDNYNIFFNSWYYSHDPVYNITFRISSKDTEFIMAYYKSIDFVASTDGCDIVKPNPCISITGCFDPIHNGHIDFIKRAREQFYNPYLIVFIPSNKLMMSYKNKCVLDAQVRKETLLNITGVSSVILLDDWKDLINYNYMIEYYIESDEYKNTYKEFYDLPANKVLFIPKSKINISSSGYYKK